MTKTKRAPAAAETAVREVDIRIRGLAPYSANAELARSHPKREDETADQHEQRTWHYRLNADRDGDAVIPGVAMKNALIAAARFLKLSIPGEGKATYAKLMEKTLIVNQDANLGVAREKVDGEWLFVPADGRRGGGKRVWKCFPKIEEWETSFQLTVFGSKLTEEVFERIATAAGRFIGLGRFRPENGGHYGRFEVASIEWREVL